MAASMRKYMKYLSITLASIIVLLAIAVVLLPTTLKWGINHWFEEHNLNSHVESVDFKLFDGQLSLKNLTVLRGQQPTLKLGSIIVRIEPGALFHHKIVLQQFSLDNFNLLAEQIKGQPTLVAGIALPSNTEAKTVTKKQANATQPWQVEVQHIELSNISSCYRQTKKTPQTLCASLHRFNWQGKLSLTLYSDTKKLSNSLQTNLSLNLKGLKLEDSHQTKPLFSVAQLALDKIHLQGLDSIAIKSIAVNEMNALPRLNSASTKLPNYVLQVKLLSATGIAIQKQQAVALKDISAHGLQIVLQRDADGKLEADKQLMKYQAAPSTPPEKVANTTTVPAKPIRLTLNQLSLLDQSSFYFIDQAVKPASRLEFHDLQLSLQNIDSTKSQARSPLQLNLRFAHHGQIKLQGDVAVFAKRPTLNVTGKLTGINLTDFNAYTEQSIQHYVKSGQLNADISININEGKLDSTTQMTLQKFYVEPITEQEAKQYQQQLGLPLGTALSLLRNRDDSITLKLPVNGDIDAPDFSLSDIVGKVSSKAIKTAIINYYTPFGVINLATGLFDLATAIRFDPIEFPVSEATLQPDNLQHLDKLTQMLTERPQLHLVVCGVATQADRLAWFPDKGDNKTDDKDKKESKLPALTEAQTQRLNTLAQQRGRAVKEYLVNEKQIAADRLILCTPKYSPGDTNPPRVELQF